ncbi:MAG: class I SAM-dependent DNA methyltransferase [Gemmatimonadetes bacterium]|nr:class I SAM-dependent DNA methyltransferase [Gemmatimonadota bacterium]
MTPEVFITKWRAAELKERSAAQEHFIDLCRLLGEPTPAEADPTGETYCFEKGARKETGGDGWADVWKRHCFAWEYKGPRANLDAAFDQLRQYALALENPPLLIVSDMRQFRIRTNWTNSVSKTHEFEIDDLADAAVRDKLKWALADPERLRPDETRQALTERAASAFALLAQALRERSHDPQAVAHFINRLVFCMFAEDVGLLPNNLFTRMLEQARQQPEEFAAMARDLFAAMATGGRVGFEPVAWFNGGLFDDDAAISLKKAEIETVLQAATLEWSEIDPSILGTLFERGLDPDKRSQLGAHYTDRDKIMQIVEPVVIRPWLAEWEKEKGEIAAALKRAGTARSAAARTRQRSRAEQRKDAFLQRLRSFTILDPACGSGNFLYVALHALKDLEHRVQLEAEAFDFQRSFPEVSPANVKGIEINAYAAELARVSVWVGHIQWMRRNGYPGTNNPVLKPLDTIECRDAILTPDGEEPEWPTADVVIGNPPFIGGKFLNANLGEDYVSRIFTVYEGRVPAEADLVCYWFVKAGEHIESGKAKRAGLVSTNSIRGGANRRALQTATENRPIFEAWSDEPWVINGAAVRVSLVCFSRPDDGAALEQRLDGQLVDAVHPDLTGNVDLTKAQRQCRNIGIAFMGDTKGGPFDVPGDQAREWLREPTNPNGRPNSDVLRPWVNGMDLTRRPAGKWIVDFGWSMGQEEAALYEAPFQHAKEHVYPMRERNRREAYRIHWWRHVEPRPGMWEALDSLSRYIATPTVAKHRLFAWLDARICPDHQLIVIARDDDTTFGILHSRFHEAWSLRLGTSLEDRPRYTPTTTFETFPFPEGLSPDIPALDYANDPRAIAIAEAARRLVKLRDRWLNPPEWVDWEDEPVPGYPKRSMPRDEATAEKLKKRTLTNLYNARPQWLDDAHKALDAAVAAAYGWDDDISEDESSGKLLALNLANGCE